MCVYIYRERERNWESGVVTDSPACGMAGRDVLDSEDGGRESNDDGINRSEIR